MIPNSEILLNKYETASDKKPIELTIFPE